MVDLRYCEGCTAKWCVESLEEGYAATCWKKYEVTVHRLSKFLDIVFALDLMEEDDGTEFGCGNEADFVMREMVGKK